MGEEKPEKGYDPNQRYRDFQWKNPESYKNGPISDDQRKCRDCFCCLLFILFLLGCVAVCVLGAYYGNPDLILYPYDEDGNQCGRGNLKDYKYLYFYNIYEDLKNALSDKKASTFCVKTCPYGEKFEEKIGTKDLTPSETTAECYKTKSNNNCSISAKAYYNSTDYMGRFCFPKIIDKKELTVYTDPTTGIEYIKKSDYDEETSNFINWSVIDTDRLITWMGDLYKVWPAILASIGWCLVICIIYMFFVRFCAGFIVYLTIILVLGCLIALGIFFWDKKSLYDPVNDSFYHHTMLGLAWFCWALAIIWFLLVMVMCNRIRLAANVMEATGRYIKETCSIFVVPVVFFFLTGAWYVYWVIMSVYLYSTGELKESSVYANIEWDAKTRYAWWFHFFALFYMNEFLKAYSQFVYASSACIWYFTHEKGTNEKPVRTSFRRGITKHCGSIAFGALIIAVIRFIMFFMEYIKKKVDQTIGKKTKAGKIYRCLISCCQCCMNCVARTMEFINRHAYIQIALKGENFCTSAFEGFGIIVRNLGRFSSLALIGSFFNLFGMVFISSASGLIGYLVITEVPYFNKDLNSPVLPTFVMVMIGFVIGYICMSIFGTSSDALMHSFLLDEELNKGQPKAFPELQKFMQDER